MMIYNLTLEELIRNANIIKEVLIEALAKEGLLKDPKLDPEILCNRYAVILKPKGLLGDIWDKIQGNVKDDQIKIEIVKSL